MSQEIWKKVKGFEKYYQVSNLGNIKGFNERKNNWILLNPWDNGNGYCVVTFYRKNEFKRINKYVHRLVAEMFIINPQNLKEVNHINLNKNDNKVENLEWVSRQQNLIHARENLGFRFSKKHHEMLIKRNKYLLARRVINIETGKIFNSLLDASTSINMNYATFKDHVSETRTKINKTPFRYLDNPRHKKA
jgi:hypothetical protein